MPESVSSAYYRFPNTCSDETEGPPDPPPPPNTSTGSCTPSQTSTASAPSAPESDSSSTELAARYAREQEQAATGRPYVYNLGITVAAEAGLGPLGSLGGAISLGVYHDSATGDVGLYQRTEKREVIGVYSGVSLELGDANSRERFEGASNVAFAEGGALGRIGIAFNETSASVSYGFGAGVAAGVAHTETSTTSAEPLTHLTFNPTTRRGP